MKPMNDKRLEDILNELYFVDGCNAMEAKSSIKSLILESLPKEKEYMIPEVNAYKHRRMGWNSAIQTMRKAVGEL